MTMVEYIIIMEHYIRGLPDIFFYCITYYNRGKLLPTRQFWDSGGVKLESLCNFSIVGCQWTVNCLLGMS